MHPMIQPLSKHPKSCVNACVISIICILIVRTRKARDLYHKSAIKTKYLRYRGGLLKISLTPVICSSRCQSTEDDNNLSLGSGKFQICYSSPISKDFKSYERLLQICRPD